jgi:leucyl aminopeptidase
MRVSATTEPVLQLDADTVAVGLVEGEGIPHDTPSGEAKARFKHLAVTHAEGRRWVLVGLGERDRLDGERLRVAAALVHGRAKELGARTLAWELPHKMEHPVTPVVEGTLLAAYAYTAMKSEPKDGGGIEELVLSDHHDRAEIARRAAIRAAAVNRARDLQNAPANHLGPQELAAAAQELAAAHPTLTCEVAGRRQLLDEGAGLFSAVAQGAHRDPARITLTYAPAQAPAEGTPKLGLVGKAVTFDTGGISLKPSAKMADMKFDMSGGAAVLAAMGAVAELELPVAVVAVIGATDNMPGGGAMRPGDVFTAQNGLTVQVDNTDAEGRLVLADCLHHAIGQGAERLIDVATLTGAIVIALGATHIGLVADDDAWAAEVQEAAAFAGELVHRLPMHEDYAELVKGRYADLINAPEGRKAGSITAGHFLQRFTGDVPWAHLDIAGTAWDTGKPYAAKGGNGVATRTLIRLVERTAGVLP